MDPTLMAGMLIISGILGVIGGNLGIDSYNREYDNWLEDNNAERENKKREYDQRVTDENLAWEIKQADAQYKAAQEELNAQQMEKVAERYTRDAIRTDTLATQNESQYANDFKNNWDILQLSFEGQDEQYLNQMMQQDSQSGNELSAMAASGTRSSSMAQAVDLEAANNAAQMQLQQDTTRAEFNYQINSLMNQLNSARTDIQQNRWQAQGLRENASDQLYNAQRTRDNAAWELAKWQEGGSEYNIHMKTLSNYQSDYDAAINEITRLETRAKKQKTAGQANAFFQGFSGGFKSGKDIFSLINTIE